MYHLKKREASHGAVSPYRPQGMVVYGKWIAVGANSTFEKTVERLKKMRGQGLVDWGIFFRGARVNEKDNPTLRRKY